MAGATAAPVSIPYVTGVDSPVPSVFTPIMAQRIHNLFLERQRFSYVWTNSAARTAQRGMVEGSLGYQVDTKTDYIYRDGNWDLVSPHSEWSAAASFGDGAGDPIGTMSLNAGSTSSTGFIRATNNPGELAFVTRGIYSVSMICRLSTESAGPTELIIRRSGGGIIATGYIMNGRSAGSVSVPNLYNTTDGNNIGFAVSKRTGGDATVQSTVRITRLG